MSKVADRVKETTTSTGQGTINLAGAAPGYQSFIDGIGDGKTCYYCIRNATQWETGIGTVVAGSPNTLERTQVKHTSLDPDTDVAIDFAAGVKNVFVTLIPESVVVAPGTSEGRLTSSSALAVTGPSQAASATLYFLPYNGNKVALYDGTGWRLHTIPDAGVALTVGGVLTADYCYDIFLYDDDGTLTLEAEVWSNHGAGTGARNVALDPVDGVDTKTGANEKRYLGTIMTVSSSGTKVEDSYKQRKIWNACNRVLRRSVQGIADWTRSVLGGATIEVWAGGDGEATFYCVVGKAEENLEVIGRTRAVSTSGQGYLDVGLNTQSSGSGVRATVDAGESNTMDVAFNYMLAIGYNYMSLLDSTSSAAIAYYGAWLASQWRS